MKLWRGTFSDVKDVKELRVQSTEELPGVNRENAPPAHKEETMNEGDG